MMRAIYMDHAATTPVHPVAAEAVLNTMQMVGNSSSTHAFGRSAKASLSAARDYIASVIGCRSGELVFTSGGTESDNTAIIGAAFAQRKAGRNHLMTTAAEHHAVLHTMQWLAKEHHFELTVLPVDQAALVTAEQVKAALRSDTALVSIMHGNNEIGSLQPIEEIGQVVQACGAVYHCDAVQALGTVSYDLSSLPIDLMSFSAHKINGPNGCGALYIAEGTPFEPLLYGGSQERKRRAGTENIASIAGFAAALKISEGNRENKQLFMLQLRKKWIELLCGSIRNVPLYIHESKDQQLPHIINISFVGIDTETMLMNLDMEGIAASSGSACTSGSLEKSHVLKSMGIPEEQLNSAVRFSFGLGNTVEELEYAANIVAKIVNRVYETNTGGF